MYKTVNKCISNRDINGALSECVRNNHYHLGVLLARLAKNGDGNFHMLVGHLENYFSNKTTTTPVQEEKTIEPVTPPVTQIAALQPIEEKPVGTTKVKLLCNWKTSKDLAECWNKMSKGNFTWNDIRLVWEGECDYVVVVNCPPMNEFPNPKKTIVFRMEPHMDRHPELWGDWSNPGEQQFLKVCNHAKEHNNVEWHLSKTYEELKKEVTKDTALEGVVSTVLSAKYKDPGHIKRIDFVKFLESKGLPVHVYGDNKWRYKDYKGSLPYHEKDNALFPYKYTFNVENHSIENYFTEKVVDGILAESLVFYNGCFNLREFLPEDSFVYLELSNFEKDYQTVKKAIEENWHEKRLPAIREAKRRILEELQFFPRLERIIKEKN